MKAKEKAIELVERMFNVDLDCENESMCMLYPHAVKCAIIAVDEILKTQRPDSNNYWKEVKQELEKL
jgi:hypothetical protein